MNKPICFSCGAKASKVCGSCHSAWYCSPECQKGHWKFHKQQCKQISEAARLMHSSSNEEKTGRELSAEELNEMKVENDPSWSNGMPRENAYQLLLDSYRLHLTMLSSEGEQFGVYNENGEDPIRHFNQFTKRANEKGMLPEWWEKRVILKMAQSGPRSLHQRYEMNAITGLYEFGTKEFSLLFKLAKKVYEVAESD